MRRPIFFLFIAALTCTLWGCLPAPFYQKQEGIPQSAWTFNFKPRFTIDIKDTTSSYQAFFIIRHTQAYPYSNLWLWVYAKTPGDSVARKARVNVVLAEPSGKWLGRGMGEIYEQRMPIDLRELTNFSKPGTYEISLEQNMRINPLPEVLNVGVRLEKSPAPKQ